MISSQSVRDSDRSPPSAPSFAPLSAPSSTKVSSTLSLSLKLFLPVDSVETSSSHAFQSEFKVEDDDTNSMPSDIGLIQHAAWIGLATITSKILGLIREIIVASVFGIGPVATAFKRHTGRLNKK
ncbi:unnamed protein product [Camellia sinensis]